MKSFSQFLSEATDPKGPIKKYMSPEEIAKKHKMSLDKLNIQLEMGIKVEHEHTGNKRMARIIALQHLEEFPDYYTRLKKAEKNKIVKEDNVDYGYADMDAPVHIKYEERYCPACKKVELRHDCKMGARYWDTFSSPPRLKEERKSGDYSLHDWFKKSSGTDPKTGKKVSGWVQIGGPFAGAPCARQPGQKSTPKCGSSKMAANLSDEEEDKAFRRKNRKDPDQPQKSGAAKPTNVATEGTIIEKKDACYSKVKSRYKVWPSAYASGALVKCRKVGAKNWGNKSESYDYSNWREEFKATEYEFFDVIKPEPLKSTSVSENYTRIQSRGTTYSILLNWRGKYLGVQMFFPQFTRPSKEQVTFEVRKIYPDANVLSFNPSTKDPTKPLLFTGDLNGPK